MNAVTHIVVVGGNYSGLSAAFALRRKGGSAIRITLVSRNQDFIVTPSMTHLALHTPDPNRLRLKLAPWLAHFNIEMKLAEVYQVQPDQHRILTSLGAIEYDQLVLATGHQLQFDSLPGLREYAHCIGTPHEAIRTRRALQFFADHPGDMVVGVERGGDLIGALEFIFELDYWLRHHGIRQEVRLHWVSESWGDQPNVPGFSDWLWSRLEQQHIHIHVGDAIRAIDPYQLYLCNHAAIGCRFAMIMPRQTGTDMVKQSPMLQADEEGYLQRRKSLQHQFVDNIWLTQSMVAPHPQQGFDVDKTGEPLDICAQGIASNIVRQLQNKPLIAPKTHKESGLYQMDTGEKATFVWRSGLQNNRWKTLSFPHDWVRLSKLMSEQLRLWKTRYGYLLLP